MTTCYMKNLLISPVVTVLGRNRTFWMQNSVNRNKRSVTLNLKSKEGCEILYKMAKNADILVESFRPNVTTKIGIDYPRIKEINNSIIYCSISGYGQEGPYKYRPGYHRDKQYEWHPLGCLT